MPNFISIDEAQAAFSSLDLTFISYLGGGSFGNVFKVRDSQNRFFALKIISPERADLNRLHREALALKRVNSPNVAKLYRWGLGDSTTRYPYLLTDFIEGEPLNRIKERGVLWTPEECVINLEYLLNGLSDLSSTGEGVVHRDIKPSNIVIRASDSAPVIIDLGLVRHLDMTSLTTTNYGFMGTPAYAPPELWSDPKRADSTTDMFSLGIIAYEMLSGRHPYLTGSENTRPQVESKMLYASALDLHDVDNTIPTALSHFIMLMIRREFSKRMRSADYALNTLRSLQI